MHTYYTNKLENKTKFENVKIDLNYLEIIDKFNCHYKRNLKISD